MLEVGARATWHIAAVAIEGEAGVEFMHVPYKGGAAAAAAESSRIQKGEGTRNIKWIKLPTKNG